jgi:hypothetical protein
METGMPESIPVSGVSFVFEININDFLIIERRFW